MFESTTGQPAPPEKLRRTIRRRRPAVFCDYDGTLTPIARRPELATISESMRGRLRRAAERFTVAIVSGRDRSTVQKLVGIDGVAYAGSHGFDITGPNGREMEHEVGAAAVPSLDHAEQVLTSRLRSADGVRIERKRFGLAVHVREADDADLSEVERVVSGVAGSVRSIRVRRGKRVLELQPDVEWDKGRAVLWLMDRLGLDASNTLVIYIGDDATDEDAFAVLREQGLGVLVAENDRRTAATYRVPDVHAVGAFIDWLTDAVADAGQGPGS